MSDPTSNQTTDATAVEHWYFRDHDTPGWGVKRGARGAMDGTTLLTGLDKSIAAAVAALLDGKVQQARDLLDVFAYLPDDALVVPERRG